MKNENNANLISASKWAQEMGITSTTLWRWRKRGVITTINIYGRLYISSAEAARFNQRAVAGEFSHTVKPGGDVTSRSLAAAPSAGHAQAVSEPV